MRIDPGQGRGAAAGRAEPAARGGSFAGALERAVRGRVDRARAEAPGEPGTSVGSVQALLADLASPGRSESLARAAGTPLLARAVERVVLLVKLGEAASVTLRLGPSLEVRIGQGRAGVEVQIEAARGLSPMAEAELPALLAALRARGVRVARARVVAGRREGRRSLTARRPSATRHGDDGTVAKW